MKLRNVGVVAVLLAAFVACDKGPKGGAVTQGGSADPWARAEPKQDPLAKPLFWSIEKDGKTSYVLGTMHQGVDAQARLPQIVWDKLDGAKTFAMEVDPSDMTGLDVMRKDGKTLRDEIGEPHWKKLEDAFGVEMAGRLNKMKAMVVATLLMTRGIPETASMDKELHARAKQQNKRFVYLETLAAELAVLEKWFDARALKESLDDLAGAEQRNKDMLAAYLAGDDVKMLAIYELEREVWKRNGHSDSEYEALTEDILYKRNASWIPLIEQLHTDGGGFVAMGALHAVGKRGVLDLLEQRGYKIVRLVPPVK
jgi:uncharacterized protein YbaP (TraB family)